MVTTVVVVVVTSVAVDTNVVMMVSGSAADVIVDVTVTVGVNGTDTILETDRVVTAVAGFVLVGVMVLVVVTAPGTMHEQTLSMMGRPW